MTARVRGVTSIYLGGASKVCPMNFFCDFFVFIVIVVDQMVLGPVSWSAKLHCTAVFALRNGKFSRLGATRPTPLLSFIPS